MSCYDVLRKNGKLMYRIDINFIVFVENIILNVLVNLKLVRR